MERRQGSEILCALGITDHRFKESSTATVTKPRVKILIKNHSQDKLYMMLMEMITERVE